jgi:thiol-disulfide isomerase/thioredoxin
MKRQAVLAVLLALLLPACQPAADAPADPATQPADGTPAVTGADPVPPDATAPDAEQAPRPEQPGLQVATIDGGQYDIAEHRGKWVVVNFWATWCSPCLKEMPELSALHTMREHITVVGLAYEEIDVPSMQSFLSEHPVAYPIAIIDVYAPPADFETPRGLPMTYLIAPDGKVARQFLGPVTAKEIETAIESNGGPKLDALPGAGPEKDAGEA